MILAVANTKGGVGKTSLAVNIAIERVRQGADVLLADADDQRTASDFVALRTERLGDPGVTCVALSGVAVREQVLRLAPKYDETVVDVGGRDTTALRAALTVANFVLIPTQPRSFDLWALETMAELISEARLVNPDVVACAILSRADPTGIGSDNREAAEALASIEGIEYLDTPIANRKAWSHAAAHGQSVAEPVRPDVKARNELWACIDGIYNRNASATRIVSVA